MTNEEIMNSQVFKFINHMIDDKASRLKYHCKELKNRIDYEPSYPSQVDTRLEEEVRGRAPVELTFEIPAIKQMIEYHWANIVQLEREINELQREKLRLLNDYDFTKGDDSFQKEIFG